MEPREPKILLNPSWSEVDKLLIPGELHAIDIETTGLLVTDPTVSIVGIGVANRNGCAYIDLRTADQAFLDSLYMKLAQVKLVAHNTLFDMGFLERDAGCKLQFVGCSLVLFKMLATEGWNMQRWGLDVAIDDILGWPANSKGTFGDLLKEEGLTKSEMYKMADLKPYEFGEYCALDAEACWQLWNYLAGQCTGPLLPTLTWMQQEFMNLINLLAEQQKRGMEIDTFSLTKYKVGLQQRIGQVHGEFLLHPAVSPHVTKFDEGIRAEHAAKEPAKLTKAGQPSVRWIKWKEKFAKLATFNTNSKKQLAWLFYDCMFTTNTIYETKRINTGKKWVDTEVEMLEIFVDGSSVRAELTKAGGRPMDKKLLPRLGPAGAMLAGYNTLVKELGYVQACLDMSPEGVLHTQYRPHGTITGRSSGSGGFNMQQQPKTKGYLKCLRAREGHKLVQLDFSALEPVVLTNASKDPTLMKLYGSDAPNDVYLFNGAHMTLFKDKIRQYYDPDNPTVESIAAAKKHCKAERGANKVVHLAKQYGAGAARIKIILDQIGFPVTIAEALLISNDWKEIYKGTKLFEKVLINEWYDREGWMYNLMLRPLGVNKEDKLQDILNTYCQSSGHDILLKYLCLMQHLRDERGVEMYPWIVDLHDESIWEVPLAHVDAARLVFRDALNLLNEELRNILTIPITGDTMVVDNLAEIKVED